MVCVFMPQLESCPFRASLNKIPGKQNGGDEVDGQPLKPFFPSLERPAEFDASIEQ